MGRGCHVVSDIVQVMHSAKMLNDGRDKKLELRKHLMKWFGPLM